MASPLSEFLERRELDRGKPRRKRNCRGVRIPGIRTASGKALPLISRLLKRDGSKCFFCLGEMRRGDITIEHLLAQSHGGSNNEHNLALAHSVCNSKAGNLSIVEKVSIRERFHLAHHSRSTDDERIQRYIVHIHGQGMSVASISRILKAPESVVERILSPDEREGG